jgi:diguanylate cyclase (GGDEF)-like protein/PAS domain S-box-containing protein
MTKIIWGQHTLKTRVTLGSVALVLLSLGGLLGYGSVQMRQGMVQELGAQQLATVTVVATQLEQRVTERLQWLNLVAQEITPDMMRQPQRLQSHLAERPILELEFNQAVVVVTGDELVLAEIPARTQGTTEPGRMDRDALRQSLTSGQVAVGQVFVDRVLGAPMLGMSAPIRDAQGKVIGALVGLTNLAKPSFLRIVTDNRYGRSGGYLLVDARQRRVITGTDDARAQEQLPATGVSPALDRFLDGYEGTQVFVNPLGTEILASDRSLPSTGWVIAAVLPTQEAYAPIRSLQWRLGAAGLLLSALAGLLTWWLVMRQLDPATRALRVLGERRPDDTGPLPLPAHAQGEIGQLVCAFQALLERLGQHERKLRQSQAMLERTERIAHVGSWEWDARADRVTWSAELFRIMGLPTTALAPSFARQATLYHPEDYKRLGQAVQVAVQQGTPYELTLRITRPDGSTRWVLARGQAASADQAGGPTLVGSLQDITDLKQAQGLLQQQVQAFADVIDTTLDGFWRTDARGHLLQTNPAYTRLSGYPQHALLGRHITELDADDSPEQVAMRLAELEREGRIQFETTHRRQDGTLWNAEISATLNRSSGEGFAFIRDITERKHADLRLRMAANVFSHALEGIIITDGQGSILEVNRAFSRITGYSREEVLGQNPRILKSDRQDQAFYDTMWAALRLHSHWSGEVWNRRKSGEVYAEILNISAVRDAHGTPQQYVALFTDISVRKAAEDQVRQMAFFDALTDLPNRRLFADRLEQALRVNQRNGLYGALLFLDLDNFKPLNDAHGHATGDLLLAEVALRLKRGVRQMDTVARIGGDEFVVLLCELDTTAAASLRQAQAVADKLLASVSAPYALTVRHANRPDTSVVHRCSASIGLTLLHPGELDQALALKRADNAMYLAKQQGRARVVVAEG